MVDHLIDNILSVLATEASLLWGVRDAVDNIKKALKGMRSFLLDFEKKGAANEGEKLWVENVRDMAYDVEDVIDEFMYYINIQRTRGRYSQFVHQIIYFPQNLWVRHQTATKLQKINKTIKTNSQLNKKYHVDLIEGKSSEDIHKWVVLHAESTLFA